MNLSKRKDLQARRKQLQERLVSEDRLRRSLAQLQPLEAAGASFHWQDKHGQQGNSPLALFPACFLTIDWSAVPGAQELNWYFNEDRATAFLEALALNGVTDPSSPLVFEWVCGADVQVHMDLSEVRRHVDVLLSMDMDTWCWRPGHQWVIEVHHDHRISWGEAPRPPLAALAPAGP